MSDSQNLIQNHASGLTPGERRVAHRLDALGKSEQMLADSGLDDRIFAATKAHLPAPRPIRAAWAFRARTRLALAACLALVGGMLWYASQSVLPPAPTLGGGSQVALAELEAEVGFTLDALLASYSVESMPSDDAGRNNSAGSFWSSASDPFSDLDEEISL
jgi:hypothetical protein